MLSSFTKQFFFVLCVFSLTGQLWSQKKAFNTTLLSNVSFGSERGSGGWGYEDPDSKIKYALIGTYGSTRIYSLEDPENPVLRHTASGAQGWWREMRSYNKHVYVSTDQGADGMVIIDMTKAPDTINHIFFQPTLTVGSTTKNLERCHNIFIDENGFCYLSGCNISNRGVLIFDLKPDPKNPVYVGSIDQNYSHDVFVRGDTVYDSQILDGRLAIFNVKDKANPSLMATKTTSRSFTHNAWPSDDTKYVFTTDERANAYVDAYDISDLNNIRLLDQYRVLETEGDGVIPHNAYYHNGFLVVSWYTDGIRILDVHRPDNMVEVGYYDTWEDPTTCHSGFNGCWGVFPFTDNNLIYGSDINNGLIIIRADYKRAAYLEGVVRDQNGKPLEGVKVTIHSDKVNREFSNAAGIYKTGHAFYGTYVVEASHPDFGTFIDSVDFREGEVTELDITMSKPLEYELTFDIKNSDGDAIPAKVLMTSPNRSVDVTVDVSGSLTSSVQSNTYNILVTSWGYIPMVMEGFTFSEATTLSIALEKGYTDYFETDHGWEILTSSANMSGVWQIATPRGTFDASGNTVNPDKDSPDYGEKAFVTENGSPGAPCADVDNGTTTLISPIMDLTVFENPMLSFSYWFYRSGGNTPFNDTLKVYLTNGETEILLLKTGSTTGGWQRAQNIKLKDFIILTDEMRIIVEVGDERPDGHIVEAGFDFLKIVEGTSYSVNPSAGKKLVISPNPTFDFITISGLPLTEQKFRCFNIMGQEVSLRDMGSGNYDVSQLSEGLYIVKSGKYSGKFLKKS